MDKNILLDQDLKVLENNEFVNIDELPMSDLDKAMYYLARAQKKLNNRETGSLINLHHDAKTGEVLGFNASNTDRNGMDCKVFSLPVYLEVKSLQYSDKISNISATFNDTTIEKARHLQDKKVFLACSVWKTASELSFIVFGQSAVFGRTIEEDVIKHIVGEKTGRIKQTVCISKLIKEYKFKVIAVGQNKEKTIEILRNISGNTFDNVDLNKTVIELEDYWLGDISGYYEEENKKQLTQALYEVIVNAA